MSEKPGRLPTTRPVSAEFKALRRAVGQAKAQGKSVVIPMYRAMSDDEKRAFIRAHRPKAGDGDE